MSSSTTASEAEQKELLEIIVTNLPLEKSSSSLTATRILFGLLRTTNILNTSKACRAALEKKIGMQLKQATLDDLLIPSYSYLNETLRCWLCWEDLKPFPWWITRNKPNQRRRKQRSQIAGINAIRKIDRWLFSKIASDANLKPNKFYRKVVWCGLLELQSDLFLQRSSVSFKSVKYICCPQQPK